MHARQNTVGAFAIAIEHGADGVELDVRRTRDGAMIVHHEERAVPNADPFITQDLKAIKAFDVWRERIRDGQTTMGVERSTFLIDESGKIARAWRKVDVDGHADEVLAATRG